MSELVAEKGGQRFSIPAEDREWAEQNGYTVSAAAPPEADVSGPTGTVHEGLRRGASMGWDDEIDAAVASLTNVLGEPKGEARGIVTRGIAGRAPTTEEFRQKFAGETDAALAANPKIGMAAEVAGGAAIPVPGAGAARGAGAVAKGVGALARPAGTTPLSALAKRGGQALVRGQSRVAPIMAMEGAGRSEGGLGERAAGAAAMTGAGMVGAPAMRGAGAGLKALGRKAGPYGRAAVAAPVGYAAGDAIGDMLGAPNIRVGKGGMAEEGEESNVDSYLGAALAAATAFSPRGALQAWAKFKGSGAKGATRQQLKEFLDLHGTGPAKRATAMEGEDRQGEFIDTIYDAITKQEEAADTVMSRAHTGLKKESILRDMTTDHSEQFGLKQADWTPKGGPLGMSETELEKIFGPSPSTPIADATAARTPRAVARKEIAVGAPPEGTPAGMYPPLDYQPYQAPPIQRAAQMSAASEMAPEDRIIREMEVHEGTQPNWRPSPGLPVTRGDLVERAVGAEPAEFTDLTPLGGYSLKAPRPAPAPDIPVVERMREERLIGEPPAPSVRPVTSPGQPQKEFPTPEASVAARAETQRRSDLGAAAEEGGRLVDGVDDLMARHTDTMGIGFSKQFRSVVDRAHAAMEGMRRPNPSVADKAETFIALDHLKRSLGKRVKAAERSSADNAAAAMDDYRGMYDQIMNSLEDPTLWGKRAAEKQRAVNKDFWVPYLESRRGYERQFLTSELGKRGDDPFDTVPEPQSGAVESLVSGAGSQRNMSREKLFEAGAASPQNLKVLAKHYGRDPEVMAAAGRAESEGTRALGAFEEAKQLGPEARQLGELGEGTASAVRRLGRYEAWESPLKGKAAGITDQLKRPAAAAPAVVSGFDRVEELVGTAPESLGSWGGDLMEAAADSADALKAKHHELTEDSPAYRDYVTRLVEKEDVRPGRGGKRRSYSGSYENP